ncbi:MAG: hypothetical protein SNG02_00415 [Rikenellaceae bacterium]
MSSEKTIIDIKHHSLMGAIMISVVVSAIYSLYLRMGALNNFETIVTPSVAGDWVYGWQLRNPILSAIIVGLGGAILSIKLGQIASRFNLYGTTTNLTMEIHPLLVMGIMVNVSSLRVLIISLLLLYSISRLFKAYRASNRAGFIVRGAIAMGLTATLYPPMIVLCGIMPFMLILFERTLREAIVTLFAILIVPFTQLYITWLIWDVSFVDSITQFTDSLFIDNDFTLLDSFNGVTIIMLALVLYTSINALFTISLLENTIKARRRLKVIGLYAVAIGLTLLFPSCDTSTFGILALPASLLIPITLLKFSRLISFIIYISFFICTIAAIF